MKQHGISRRSFMMGVATSLGATLTPIGQKAFAAAIQAADTSTGNVMSTEQLEVTRIAADLIIPTTDTPGASAAGVHHFINHVLSHYLSEQERNSFLQGLDELARSEGGFLKLGSVQRQALLVARDKGRYQDEFFMGLKEAVVFGYYTSQIGASQELGYSPVPGPYREVPFSDVGKVWY